jgi:hypothetical protein
MHRRLAWLAVAATVALPASARATFFGDAIQIDILRENIQQTIQMTTQLEQLRQMLSSAQQTLSFTRSVYAGIQDLQHFDGGQFLDQSKAYFLQQNPPLGEAKYFGEDVVQHGPRGYFNAAPVNRAIERADVFGEGRSGGSPSRPPQYDVNAALGFGSDFDRLVAARARAARSAGTPDLAPFGTPPPPPSATEGLIDYQMMRSDPQLAAALSQARANSQVVATTAMEAYLKSLGASPGQAELLSARATSLTAAQVAQLNDTQARALALREHEYAERASAQAAAGAEHEALWRDINDHVARDFNHERRLPAAPSLADR